LRFFIYPSRVKVFYTSQARASIGIFFVLTGVIIAVDVPFMKEILDEVDFLNKNRRIIGTAIALIGFVLIFFS
jgi:hydrogenase/urease accessory protein HupE